MASEQPVAIPPELKLQALLYRWLAPHFSGEMLRFYVKDLMPKLAEALDAARQQQRANIRQAVIDMHVAIAGGTDGEDLHHWQGFNEAIEAVVATLADFGKL